MSTNRRGRDFESNYLAMRRRMQSLGTVVLPAPATIGPHTHSADQITFEPYGLLAADDVQEALEEHDEEKLARSGVQPMLGDLNMNTFDVYDLGQIRWDKDTVVAAVDGGLQWADDSGIERLVMTAAGDAGNVDMPLGGVYVKVRNNTGGAIAAAKPVYVYGADDANNLMEIALAADTLALNDTQRGGMTMQSIADGAKGWVCIHGYLGGVDLSSYGAGMQLYVGTNPGDLTDTPPAKGCGARIRMGLVIVAASPGSMWVDVDWRPDADELANVSIGEFAVGKQNYDVLMWQPNPSGEPCSAWRDYPASRFPYRIEGGSGDYAVQDKDVIILVEADSADVTITLPALTVENDNRLLRIKKLSGAYKVIIDGDGATIEGLSTVSLLKVGEALDVQGLDTNWVCL